MTSDQFNRALVDLGLSQSETARLWGLGARTVRRYAAGQEIPEPVAILVNLLLGGVVTPAQVDAVR